MRSTLPFGSLGGSVELRPNGWLSDWVILVEPTWTLMKRLLEYILLTHQSCCMRTHGLPSVEFLLMGVSFSFSSQLYS
eukprot:m.641 g.641  ORF g.641 m.641 type:complete len:78 (+) comp3938_c0_seq1:197-430(+)